MRRNLVVAGVATLALLLSLGLLFNGKDGRGLVPGAQAKGGAAPQIEGTWLLTVTTPPEAGRAPFQVLISFARGGVFLASAETGEQGLPPQHGAWQRVGAREFATTALSFGRGANPTDVFTIKVKSLFRLVGEDELEGVGQGAICDAAGNNCQPFPGCSTLHATRLSVEPPSCPGA